MADYGEYLTSLDWQRRRTRALERANDTCERCGTWTRRLEVHHVRYDNLGNEEDDDLVVLCDICHAWAEWHKDMFAIENGGGHMRLEEAGHPPYRPLVDMDIQEKYRERPD